MDKLDFVHLACHIVTIHSAFSIESGATEAIYDDNVINIDISQNGMFITRKAKRSADELALRFPNVVTVVSATSSGDDPEIVIHQGDHNQLVPHMMGLIKNFEPTQEFYTEMLNKYPEIVGKQGI